jgi:plastocyanin
MKASTNFRVRLVMLATIVAGLSAAFPVAAQAADGNVGVEDNSFTPGRIAVKPGEKVTWTNPGSGEQHNFRFEGEQATFAASTGPWSSTRTFLTEGAFRFYCEIHGAPGGAGMTGVVYVNSAGDLPPVVPPTASFTASPNPVQAGQAVGFDASGSSDSDGTIARYEWDLDGNGAFETNTTSPTVSYSYLSPATLTVTLRVTDRDGATAETTRALQINAAPAPSPQPAPQPQPTPQQQPTPVPQTTSQPQPKPSSTSTKPKPGKCSKLKGKKRAACIKKSCRKLKGAKMKACVKKVTRKS